MACDSSTKWVVGAASMMFCTSSGMLSRGVMAPDSSCSGSSTSTSSMPNCGMLRASVARKIPSDVVANRSEEHTSELQSQSNLVCRLLLEKKKKKKKKNRYVSHIRSA